MKKILSLFVSLLLCLPVLSACAARPADVPDAADIKVALVLNGVAEDAYNADMLNALVVADTALGVQTDTAANVDAAGAEAVLRGYAEEDYALVIAHGPLFAQAATAVAGAFPAVRFVVTDAFVAGDNLAGYQVRGEDGAYLMGVLCAGVSATGVVGAVGAQNVPDAVPMLEAFRLGALEVNPDVQVHSVTIADKGDTAAASDAAIQLVAEGTDAFFHVAGEAGKGVVTVAANNGLYVCGSWTDMPAEAPDTILCTLTLNYGPMLTTAVEAVVGGYFEGGGYALGIAEGVVGITDYGELDSAIPEEIKQRVASHLKAFEDGEFTVPYVTKPTA